ncbi:CD1375 family protein [Paenibacillus naphthalenovorans]|uniref:CD1375 family protein n=1 Tax=Paenibacillus naphthalenovorans TaxID=162209 RepID=UPI00088EA317|nr:CD1375 family protein [Paenibacillus naphthalenovorans]SDI48773.1 hypothetical protein SAMN05421868_10711 [Paenibacillus naphthalenovorans]
MTLSMVDVYFELVKAGIRKLDQVPECDELRSKVEALLNKQMQAQPEALLNG